jgi:hypothetical protein
MCTAQAAKTALFARGAQPPNFAGSRKNRQETIFSDRSSGVFFK